VINDSMRAVQKLFVTVVGEVLVVVIAAAVVVAAPCPVVVRERE